MPVTIGINSNVGLFGATMLTTDEHVLMSGPTYSGVLPPGERWSSIGFVDRAVVGDIMQVGIYDITSGVDGALLIASENITTEGNAGAQIVVQINGVGIPGNTYAVACRPVGDCSLYRNTVSGESVESSLTGASPLAASFTDDGIGNQFIIGIFADSSVPAQAVTQADVTPEDGVIQTFVTAGLTGPITAGSLGGTDILALLSDTDPTTATTYTLDVSATELSEGMPRIGETSTLSVTATGGTATTDVVIQPKTGWSVVTLAGTLSKGVDDFLTLADSTLGITTVVGDIVYYNSGRGEVINAQGDYLGGTTVPFQSTEFVIQQGGSATTTATSQGGAFYPFGEGSNVPKTKFRRFPWQPWNKL